MEIRTYACTSESRRKNMRGAWHGTITLLHHVHSLCKKHMCSNCHFLMDCRTCHVAKVTYGVELLRHASMLNKHLILKEPQLEMGHSGKTFAWVKLRYSANLFISSSV